MRTARRIGVAAGVILALGVLGLMCRRVGERGRYAVAYSTYGAGPQGTRALYLLAAESGLEPVRWSRDLAGLPERGLLVALGGCENPMARPVSRYERETLERWVEGGGVLLVAGAHEYLWPELGVHLWRPAGECLPELGIVGTLVQAEQRGLERDGSLPPPPDAGVAPAPLAGFAEDPIGTVEQLGEGEDLPPPRWALPAGPPLGGLGSVPLRRPASIVVGDEARSTTILRLPSGPAGVIVRRGEGAVVALASASPFQNRELANADGGVLFARLVAELAPEGPVMFDEYHLGVGERRSLTQYLRDVGAGGVALQVLVVIAFLLWRSGTRFGGTKTAAPPVPAGTASYVSAIGTLYTKSGDTAGAVGLLARYALQRVADHHHLPFADATALARRLEEWGRTDEAEAVRRLGAIAASPGTERRHLVARAREIDDLVALATGGESESR